MRKGSIKNYIEYYNKIISYAELCHVKMYFVDFKETEEEKDMGEYLWLCRSININMNMTQKEIIAVMLHELGHFEDHKNNPKCKSTENAYIKLSKGKVLTPRQKELIVQCERTAWELGRGIANKLMIPLGSWYTLEEMAGVGGYCSMKTK